MDKIEKVKAKHLSKELHKFLKKKGLIRLFLKRCNEYNVKIFLSNSHPFYDLSHKIERISCAFLFHKTKEKNGYWYKLHEEFEKEKLEHNGKAGNKD